jgi:ABC-2 type transport system permease protein
MTGALAYTRFELLRTLRNRRFMIFSLIFPLALFFALAGANHGTSDFADSGISATLYYMVGLLSFGTIAAMLSCGARIAAERTAGWNRQLRITPLSPRAYLRAKVLTGYMMAGLTVVALYAAGAILGVSLPADRWLEMTGLIAVGLIPFAAIGIMGGHLLTSDSIGPAMGGSISLFAFFGGSWFPLTSGFLHDLGQALPSYWIVQAAHLGLGGSSWSATGWICVAAWTAGAGALAAWAYRRDTGRA